MQCFIRNAGLAGLTLAHKARRPRLCTPSHSCRGHRVASGLEREPNEATPVCMDRALPSSHVREHGGFVFICLRMEKGNPYPNRA